MPIYQIKSGDTLAAIAKRNGVSVGAMLKANPSVKNPNQIFAGQKLNIPSNTFRAAPKPPAGLPNVSGKAAPKPAPAATPAGASKYGKALVANALSQRGVHQDCTAMVEKALRSIGKKVGDLAPAQFFQYGKKVSKPQPGDLVYYKNGGTGLEHIAIYIGNGKAVHGGWEGGTTAVGPVNVGSGPASYIRVT